MWLSITNFNNVIRIRLWRMKLIILLYNRDFKKVNKIGWSIIYWELEGNYDEKPTMCWFWCMWRHDDSAFIKHENAFDTNKAPKKAEYVFSKFEMCLVAVQRHILLILLCLPDNGLVKFKWIYSPTYMYMYQYPVRLHGSQEIRIIFFNILQGSVFFAQVVSFHEYLQGLISYKNIIKCINTNIC